MNSDHITQPTSPRPANRTVAHSHGGEQSPKVSSPEPRSNANDASVSVKPLPGFARLAQRPRAYHRLSGALDTQGVPAHLRMSGVNDALTRRYQVREAEEVARLYKAKKFRECSHLCSTIIEDNACTEAILARMHMVMAEPEIDAYSEGDKICHLKKAIKNWNITIKRKGTSRLPLHLARQERERAVEMLEIAKAECLNEHKAKVSLNNTAPSCGRRPYTFMG